MLVYYNTLKQVTKEDDLSKIFDAVLAGTYQPKSINKYYTFKGSVTSHKCKPYSLKGINIIPLDNPEEHYITFSIPKKTGGFREICAPDDTLKTNQQLILNSLKHLAPYAHNAAYAYVPGRCCKDALLRHTKNKSHWFLKLDLHAFFPSCTKELVHAKFEELFPFYNLDLNSMDLIDTYCFKDGILPQGAPTSPYISNLIMTEFDYNLTEYCVANNLVYTRYADDLLISGYELFDWRGVQTKVIDLLKTYPTLQLNTEKTRFGNSAGKNWNLGMMITKENTITVGNKRKRQLKQSLYNYTQHKNNFELNDLQTLLGELQYVCMIEPNIYSTMYEPKFGDIRKDLIDNIKQMLS